MQLAHGRRATIALERPEDASGTNDAAGPTASGTYPADAPIHLQWDTPLPGTATYPVRVVLNLETTYADGTVRTSQVAGTVPVTIIYSAVSQ